MLTINAPLQQEKRKQSVSSCISSTLLIFSAVLLLVLIISPIVQALEICPAEKLPTEITIDHSRHPRNLIAGITENWIDVEITLEWFNPDTGDRGPMKNTPMLLQITLLNKFLTLRGDRYELVDNESESQILLQTDENGKIKLKIPTDPPLFPTRMDPRKISYSITANYAPAVKDPFIGSSATASYTPSAMPPVSLAACLPLFAILALLMAAMYASGRNPFAFLDISRFAFRGPGMKRAGVKKVTKITAAAAAAGAAKLAVATAVRAISSAAWKAARLGVAEVAGVAGEKAKTGAKQALRLKPIQAMQKRASAELKQLQAEKAGLEGKLKGKLSTWERIKLTARMTELKSEISKREKYIAKEEVTWKGARADLIGLSAAWHQLRLFVRNFGADEQGIVSVRGWIQSLGRFVPQVRPWSMSYAFVPAAVYTKKENEEQELGALIKRCGVRLNKKEYEELLNAFKEAKLNPQKYNQFLATFQAKIPDFVVKRESQVYTSLLGSRIGMELVTKKLDEKYLEKIINSLGISLSEKERSELINAYNNALRSPEKYGQFLEKFQEALRLSDPARQSLAEKLIVQAGVYKHLDSSEQKAKSNEKLIEVFEKAANIKIVDIFDIDKMKEMIKELPKEYQQDFSQKWAYAIDGILTDMEKATGKRLVLFTDVADELKKLGLKENDAEKVKEIINFIKNYAATEYHQKFNLSDIGKAEEMLPDTVQKMLKDPKITQKIDEFKQILANNNVVVLSSFTTNDIERAVRDGRFGDANEREKALNTWNTALQTHWEGVAGEIYKKTGVYFATGISEASINSLFSQGVLNETQKGQIDTLLQKISEATNTYEATLGAQVRRDVINARETVLPLLTDPSFMNVIERPETLKIQKNDLDFLVSNPDVLKGFMEGGDLSDKLPRVLKPEVLETMKTNAAELLKTYVDFNAPDMRKPREELEQQRDSARKEITELSEKIKSKESALKATTNVLTINELNKEISDLKRDLSLAESRFQKTDTAIKLQDGIDTLIKKGTINEDLKNWLNANASVKDLQKFAEELSTGIGITLTQAEINAKNVGFGNLEGINSVDEMSALISGEANSINSLVKSYKDRGTPVSPTAIALMEDVAWSNNYLTRIDEETAIEKRDKHILDPLLASFQNTNTANLYDQIRDAYRSHGVEWRYSHEQQPTDATIGLQQERGVKVIVNEDEAMRVWEKTKRFETLMKGDVNESTLAFAAAYKGTSLWQEHERTGLERKSWEHEVKDDKGNIIGYMIDFSNEAHARDRMGAFMRSLTNAGIGYEPPTKDEEGNWKLTVRQDGRTITIEQKEDKLYFLSSTPLPTTAPPEEKPPAPSPQPPAPSPKEETAAPPTPPTPEKKEKKPPEPAKEKKPPEEPKIELTFPPYGPSEYEVKVSKDTVKTSYEGERKKEEEEKKKGKKGENK